MPWLTSALTLVACSSARAQESWDAIYLAGSKIGYVHIYVEAVSNRGRQYKRVRVDTEQKLKRNNDVTVTRLSYGTIETPAGQVLRLDTLTWTGEQKLRAHGDVINGRMTLILEGTGERQEKVIPWGPRGARTLRRRAEHGGRKPMKENETRHLKMFMPELNKICDISSRPHRVEPVILGDGKPQAAPARRADHQGRWQAEARV